MITLKSAHEIELMRRAGKITAAARALAGEMVKPGVTTQEIDRAVEHFIRKQGAVPSFLHFPGPPGVRAFPGSVCASVNDEIIHGIPGPRVLQEGDIVSIDVGAYIGGYHGDCAATFPCGKVSPEAQNLIDVTRQSFFEGMTIAVEPMVNAGTAAIRQMPDGWTVRTADGKLAAHYENTLLITDGEPEILTAPAI